MSSERFSLPTLEESQQLRQAEAIVHGNLVQLETEELLKELNLDYENLPTIEKTLFTLRSRLLSTPPQLVCAASTDGETNSPTNSRTTKNGTATTAATPTPTPLTLPAGTSMRRWTTDLSSKRAQGTTLNFQPPTQVELMGSFLLRTVAKPRCTVDLAVHMPESCFLSKDLLDYRYHDKRLLYLTWIKEHLNNMQDEAIEEEEEEEDAAAALHYTVSVVGLASPDDVSSKPILQINLLASNKKNKKNNKKNKKIKKMKKKTTPNPKLEEDEHCFTFHIHLVAPTTVFDMNRLAPTSGNLRIHRRKFFAELFSINNVP